MSSLSKLGLRCGVRGRHSRSSEMQAGVEVEGTGWVYDKASVGTWLAILLVSSKSLHCDQ